MSITRKNIFTSRCRAIICTKFLLSIYSQSDRIIDMKTKIMSAIPLIAIFATIGLITTTIPAAHAQVNVPSTATILGVCGVTPVPTAINYGALAPSAASSDQTLQLTNPGNVQATVLVKGTDWSTATISNAMLVSATHYSLTSGQSYASKTALTGTDTQLTTLNALQQKNTFWQLTATLNDPTAVGPATQVVTLTGQC
jgi:hypothetical protein